MRVLLIYPIERDPAGHYMVYESWMPLGLGYLAAVLEREGHEVEVMDFQIDGVTLEQLEERVRSRSYDLFGLGATTPHSMIAYRIASRLKEIAPRTPVALGGPHTIAVGNVVFEDCPALDYVVFGEGEITILELLEVVRGERSPESVNGIGFRKEGEIVLTPEREFVKDLDSIPFPAFHLFELTKYKPLVAQYRRLPWASVITHRGCPYRCLYCNHKVWGYTCRIRSAQNVFDEIMLLKNRFGVREISFTDDTFTISRKRTVELCELLIEASIPVIWKCSTRVDCVDFELLKLIKRAGCYSIGYGVESGSQKILDYIKKGITKEQVRAAFRDSRRAGMETRAYFMLNLPQDDPETTEETIGFSRELDADYVDFEISHPFPGTEFRRLVETDDRYTIIPKEWNNPKGQIGNRILYTQPGLDEAALRKYMKRAFRGYYLRPKQILRHSRSLFTPGRALNTLRDAWNILTLRVAE